VPKCLPSVRTFHDSALVRFPQSLRSPAPLARLFLQILAICMCDGVACVSKFSQAEFKSTFALLPRILFRKSLPTAITPNASSLQVSSSPSCDATVTDGDASISKYSIPSVFKIFYIGLRFGYKNFISGLTAIANVHDRLRALGIHTNLSLTVVSNSFLSESERGALSSLSIPVQSFVGVNKSQLLSLYSSSSLLLHTSLYEGFGICVLEAMACKCPVLAVDIPAVREIAGNTIRYSKDGAGASISSALLSCILDYSNLVANLNAAYRGSLRYTWDSAASSLEELYLSLR
jgi:glycosyltransferase involved in cell wall biosynthesis